MKTLVGFVMTALVTLSAFAFPQMAHAQSGRGWMDGFIKRERWTQPAAGATVELTPLVPLSSAPKLVAKANDRGEYELKDIRYGEYTLRVSAEGCRPYQIELYIMPDAQTKLHVLLKKEKETTTP
jgi:hypothetical protein